MERLLHTPEGVRDIYDEECRKKNVLSDKLVQTLNLYGYEDIQTPSFEFFDILGSLSKKFLNIIIASFK